MDGFSKQELRDLCDNARMKPCISNMGSVYVFTMPGCPTQRVYNWSSQELYLVHMPTATARLIGRTKTAMTKTEFEIKSKNSFLKHNGFLGGISQGYLDEVKKMFE